MLNSFGNLSESPSGLVFFDQPETVDDKEHFSTDLWFLNWKNQKIEQFCRISTLKTFGRGHKGSQKVIFSGFKMRLQETLELIAFNTSKDVSKDLSELKSFIVESCRDKDAFFWIDEIIQEIVQNKPDSRSVITY